LSNFALALKFFTVLNIFLPFRILSNLHLPWKQSVPWIHCIQGRTQGVS